MTVAELKCAIPGEMVGIADTLALELGVGSPMTMLPTSKRMIEHSIQRSRPIISAARHRSDTGVIEMVRRWDELEALCDLTDVPKWLTHEDQFAFGVSFYAVPIL